MIYIATHKKVSVPSISGYKLIQVGAAGKEKIYQITDDTGDNISKKNPNYSELTAIYWMWKNVSDDIIGLVHYRRFFFYNRTTKLHILKQEEIVSLLKDYDLIVPKKTVMLRKSIKENYAEKHNIEDLMKCREIIAQKYPQYLKEFDEVLDEHSYYAFNMFISSNQLFQKYAEWLFDILFEVEKETDISSYDAYNKRIYGFLSERLFNVWIKHHNKLSIKELPVFNLEKKNHQLIRFFIDDVKRILVH